MTSIDCPTLRIPNSTGGTVVREGAVIRLFIRRSHREIATAAVDALERFRAFAGDAFPRIYVDHEGDLVRWSDEAAARAFAELREWPNYSLQLLDSGTSAPAVSFGYDGSDLDILAASGFPNSVSMITVGLSRDLLDARGPSAVAQFATELASSVPVESGYASLALHHDNADSSFAAMRHFCFNFPGLDIADPDLSMRVGGRVRGAYWLNFFGPAIAERLGPIDSPVLQVDPLPGGGLRVLTTEAPSSGNLAQDRDLPECRELAGLLEPLLYQAPQPFPEFTPEETLRWERRFLDGSHPKIG